MLLNLNCSSFSITGRCRAETCFFKFSKKVPESVSALTIISFSVMSIADWNMVEKARFDAK